MTTPDDIGGRGPDRGRSYDCAAGNHPRCAGTYLGWGADEDSPCACDCHPSEPDAPDDAARDAELRRLLPPIGDDDGR